MICETARKCFMMVVPHQQNLPTQFFSPDVAGNFGSLCPSCSSWCFPLNIISCFKPFMFAQCSNLSRSLQGLFLPPEWIVSPSVSKQKKTNEKFCHFKRRQGITLFSPNLCVQSFGLPRSCGVQRNCLEPHYNTVNVYG